MKLSQLLTAALAIAILCLAFTRIKINNQKSDIEFMSQIVMLKLDRDCNVFDSIEIDLNPNNSNHQMLAALYVICLLYTSPSPRDATLSRMPSSA